MRTTAYTVVRAVIPTGSRRELVLKNCCGGSQLSDAPVGHIQRVPFVSPNSEYPQSRETFVDSIQQPRYQLHQSGTRDNTWDKQQINLEAWEGRSGERKYMWVKGLLKTLTYTEELRKPHSCSQQVAHSKNVLKDPKLSLVGSKS